MDPSSIITGAIAVMFRVFVAQPFTIPASSMAPTLELDDYVWVTKFSYGYSNYSFPLGQALPSFTYAKTDPDRGDVIVFRPPHSSGTDYVKRVIGLPGDKVKVENGITYLNDQALPLQKVGPYQISMGPADLQKLQATKLRETLPGGRSYFIVDSGPSVGDDTPAFVVPADHYFVMGDNRDNSSDSRFSVGFVPKANIIGKAVIAISWPDGQFTQREIK